MNQRPLVSVIIIFLNAERFLQEAIETVFAQTYTYWELLLVDDGSTDGSTALAAQHTQQCPEKVRLLAHNGRRNLGMSASRNLGIRHASGKYIAFLDADDTWFVNTLTEQVAALETHREAAMVYGPLFWWYSWNGNCEDSRRDYIESLGVPLDTLIRPPRLLPLFLLDKAAVPSGILVRREVIKRIGGFEESFRGEYEDQVFCAKICLHAPVFASGRCWYRYRQHPDSSVAVGQKNGQTHAARLSFLNWLEGYLRQQGVKDTAVWQAVRHELRRSRYPRLFRLARRGRYFTQQMKQNLTSQMKSVLLGIGQHTVPAPLHRWLWARWYGQTYCPPVGHVHLGSLRRLTPFSREFGYDRGRPIDRYYIEKFLLAQKEYVQGRVLEVADNHYTRQFGGRRVAQSDVLHVSPDEPGATIVGDLTDLDHVPADTFDCIILTQTLQVIYDVPAALQTTYRILKPGGVLLTTFPGLSPISRYDMERWGYYWGFTSLSAQRLFTEVFPESGVQIQAYGNVLAATAFLYGMATEELQQEELEYADPDYEVIIAVRARKLDVE